MSDYLLMAAMVLAAYVIGSISFAVVISWLFHLQDPRQYGSKNPGATNVLRSGNKLAALLTLLLDGAKGWFAVWALDLIRMQWQLDWSLIDTAYPLVMIAVFLGQVFPLFLRFKGGKGVATFLGVMLAVNAWLGVACMASWLIVAFFFRYSSLAAMLAAIFSVFYFFLLFGANSKLIAVVVIAVVLIWRHQGNIQRLLQGKEPRIGKKT